MEHHIQLNHPLSQTISHGCYIRVINSDLYKVAELNTLFNASLSVTILSLDLFNNIRNRTKYWSLKIITNSRGFNFQFQNNQNYYKTTTNTRCSKHFISQNLIVRKGYLLASYLHIMAIYLRLLTVCAYTLMSICEEAWRICLPVRPMYWL